MTEADTAKNWREAMKPKWAAEAAQAEIDRLIFQNALRWPMEAEPKPVPFRWGDYDHLTGTPEAGEYWSTWHGRTDRIQIREKQEGEAGRGSWRFNCGYGWSAAVRRGPLYRTEKDATLALLWEECRKAAKTLAPLHAQLELVRSCK